MAPDCSTASQGPVSSTCSMPSGATRKATFCGRAGVGGGAGVGRAGHGGVLSVRRDGRRRVRRRCATTGALPTSFPGMPWATSTTVDVAPQVSDRRCGRSVPGMALHCAATLVLVPVGTAPDDAAGAGAVVVGPLAPGADVVAELQALADLHRGERVVRAGGARAADRRARAPGPSARPGRRRRGRSRSATTAGRLRAHARLTRRCRHLRSRVGCSGGCPGSRSEHPTPGRVPVRRGGARCCRCP